MPVLFCDSIALSDESDLFSCEPLKQKNWSKQACVNTIDGAHSHETHS